MSIITPDIPKNLSMTTSMVIPKSGYKVGRIRPDENGIFRDVPVMCLNSVSRSGEKYDQESFWRCATDPKLQFRQKVNERGLFGENGHPPFYGIAGKSEEELRKMGVIDRFMTVAESNTCHQIYDVRPGKTLADGTQFVLNDLKPVKPMGDVLEEELNDPTRNASFSVRQYSTKVRNKKGGYLDAFCRALVTFDRVNIGGFAKACIAESPGLSQESMPVEDLIIMDDGGKIVFDHFSTESFKDTALNDALQCAELIKIDISRTMISAAERNRSKFPGLYVKDVIRDNFLRR